MMVSFLFFVGCDSSSTQTPSKPEIQIGPIPAELSEGESLFNANCAKCHGSKASGSPKGPPLIHRVYEPNHHGDASFHRAVQAGVRSHHWQFGDMPPVQGVNPEDVNQIVAYVRWLQKQAGIF